MVNTERLRQAVSDFAFDASPTSASASTPATVGDVNKLIEKTAIVLNQFIEELENDD